MYNIVVGRPIYLSADLDFTTILLLLLLLLLSIYLLFPRLPSELAERNSTKTVHMLGSAI